MTAQHQFSEVTLDAWFHPIHLPAEAYLRFVRELNVALADLEKREGVRQPFSSERHSHGLPHKLK